MNFLEMLIDSSLIHRLGWTLVHFLWQGAMVGLIYLCVRHILKEKSPKARYHLALGTLAAMAVLPVITFIHLTSSTAVYDPHLSLHALAIISAPHAQPTAGMSSTTTALLSDWLQPLIPWAVPAWLLGVGIATIRVFQSWLHAHHIRGTATFIQSGEWQSTVEKLCLQFGIHKVVRLAISAGVAVPSVLGWLKPVILIPPSTIAGLTPKQMELILAHELAHICRQDYFWNLLQVAVETLLFYHPVVGWISSQARIERELCCDDMVVGLHGNAVAYARALTELETLRHPRKVLLLGADGGQIFNRIQRLITLRSQDAPVFWLPLLLISGLLLTVTITQFARHQKMLQPVLASKYTLLGNVSQQDSEAQTKSANSIITPLRIPIVTVNMPPVLKTIHIPNGITVVTPAILAELAQPVPAQPDSVPEKLALKSTSSKNDYLAASIITVHAPVYPELALERGVEGTATVEFTLTPAGDIRDMRVTHVSGSRLFGQAAMDALRNWKFASATVAGVPVAQYMVEDFVYRLKEQTAKGGTCNIPTGYHVCLTN